MSSHRAPGFGRRRRRPEDAELLWLLPLLTMFAPGDRPETTSDQQPEEASESVASDASARGSQRTRMKIADSEERRRQRFSNGRSSLVAV